ncbi:transcriptional regulator Myc-B-like [Scylla paramamosain]
MALSCPELVPESWLAPSHLAHPDDLWIKFEKFEFDNERTLVLPNPSPTSDQQFASFLDMGGGGIAGALHPPGALPTPPHSPPTEHDLDDLVASIPEILESPSASPPSAISEILSDLEGMEATSSPPRLEGTWGADWWGSALVTPPIEASIKRDIMWGGGGSCSSTNNTTTVTTTTTTPAATVVTPKVEVKKERQDSESSTEAYRDVIYSDDLSDESDTDDLPDTPSCTDSDCDADDPLWTPPHHPHQKHHQVATTTPAAAVTPAGTTLSHQATPAVDIEHNYCEPNHHLHHHHTTGTITPSDTEDEVDVVSCPEQDMTTTTTTTTTTTNSRLLPPATQTPATTTTTTKASVDVKRQLQLAIQEAVRNRQNKNGVASTGGDGGEVAAPTRLVSVKIKTQGKPAAYTKRMRDYHSEVVKSTKHRRRNKGDNDEGRRSVHNSLERQRRVDLRNAFETLRQLVPDTKIQEKAPKVQILKKAALHCKNLQQAELRLLREKEKLKRQLQELEQRKALCCGTSS